MRGNKKENLFIEGGERMLENFVEEEFGSICRSYPSSGKIKNISLNFTAEKFFMDFKHTITTDRRGEVGFVLRRRNGKYVTVRSERYPRGTYRIPTGGINFDETALGALFREVKEELGVSFEISEFAGLLEYQINYKNEALKFYSYLFLIDETGGSILKDATEDEVSEIKELDREGLIKLEEKFTTVDSRWRDWAKFRVELLKFFNEYLEEKNEK